MFNRKFGYFIGIALLVGWAIYCYNPFLLWFQNDDFSHILLSRKEVFFQRNSFRPVCDISIMADYFLWGSNAAGYHITNLLLHLVCTVMVYFFSRRIFSLHNAAGTSKWVGAIAAALFFTYPFHSEAVFWILGRSGVLGAIFFMVFLLFFLGEERSRRNSILGLLAFAIALLTYESCWVLPLLAYILSPGNTKKGYLASQSKRYYPLVLIFIIYLAARVKINHGLLGTYEGINFLQFNAVALVGNFLKLSAMGFTANTETPAVLFISFAVLCAGLIYFFIKRFNTYLLKLAACFFISLAPYLSLGIDTHGTEGQRFLYLPSVFVVLIIVAVLNRLQSKGLRGALACITGLLYAGQLYVNAVNYRFAGGVVKQTIAQVAKVPNGKTIVMQGVPKSQHGALIFAAGLPDAVAFYLPDKHNTLIINSWRYELNALSMPYKTVEMPVQIATDTVRYVFTDSALVVYP